METQQSYSPSDLKKKMAYEKREKNKEIRTRKKDGLKQKGLFDFD